MGFGRSLAYSRSVMKQTVLARLGAALWTNPEDAAREVSSRALLVFGKWGESDSEASHQHLTRALLQAASGASQPQRMAALSVHPIYTLSIEERWILLSLHARERTYAQLARELGKTPDAIEVAAWRARLSLRSELATREGIRAWAYPVASSARSVDCPELDLLRPWTQRYLDGVRESRLQEIFLRTHLERCEGCRQTLERARALYYAVDASLAKLDDSGHVKAALESVTKLSRTLQPSVSQPTRELWFRFMRQPVFWLSLAIWIALIARAWRS